MAIVPVKIKWSQSIDPGSNDTFVLETKALANTKAVYNPVLRFYNFSTEAMELKITHNFTMGSGSDPLNSGSFSIDVVDESVPSSTFRDYSFGGTQLDDDTVLAVSHTVTITNPAGNTLTNTVHTLLLGRAEVETQLPAGQEIIRGT